MRGKLGVHSPIDDSRFWRGFENNFERFSQSRISFLIFLIPLLVLIPALNLYPYPASGSLYSDLTITHYPNIQFIKNSIIEYRQIPLWSPMILSGSPFVANPLSGLWYPFAWVLLLLPLPLGFNLLVAVHLIWAGLGTYYLLKTEGVSQIGALFAGLSFALLPKFFSHYGAGHLTLLFAIPWTPWLLFCQAKKSQFVSRHVFFRFTPALILSLICMADIRWGAIAVVLWLAYSAINRKESWRAYIVDIISQVTLTFILIAPFAFPLFEFIQHSSRSGLVPEESLIFSLPPANLIGFLFPDGIIYHEWMLYSGATVIILALLTVMIRKTNRRVIFWFVVFVLSLILAFGSGIPGMVYLVKLPLLGLLRVPARTLFITGLSLSALAGYGFDLIVELPQEFSKRATNLLIFSSTVFVGVISTGLVVISGSLPFGVVRGVVFLLIAAAWIGARIKFHTPKAVLILGLFVILILDLLTVDFSSFRSRDVRAVFSEGEEAAEYLSSKPDFFRTYSPSYSLPQHTASGFGLQLADGVDPLQINDYVEYMVIASGVPQNGYSVTTPPFDTGDPRIDNAIYSPNIMKLSLLNIGYVVADYDVEADGLILEEQFDETRVYRNTHSMPRAWVEDSIGGGQSTFRPAEIIKYSPNRIVVSAVGPGMLVFSEINYPGWWIWSKGELLPVDNFGGLFRSVQLAPGEQTISMIYIPTSFVFGILICLLGIFGWAIFFSRPRFTASN